MFWLKRKFTEWRHEPGPGYDIRQYFAGQPTGLFAKITQHGPDVTRIPGEQVELIVDAARLSVLDWRGPGHDVVRLEIPLESCMDIQVLDESGLPGTAPVRLDLTFRFGPDGTVTVPMWFPGEQRAWLQDLKRLIRKRPVAPPAQGLPVLDVELAPDTGDWVVFRAQQSSTEVLREHELLARRNGEQR
jgi:hypothetical protein